MNNENSINGREEAWPRLGRQASSIMYRPNQPASIVLPQTRAARLPQPLPSPSYSSKSSSTHAGSSLNPSYYSVSPPSARDALPTSSPLVKQRTAPADPSQHTGMPGLPPFILTNGKLASCPSPSPSGTTTLSESEDDRLIHHQHCGHARSGSAETLRGPLLSTTNLTEDNNSRASSECSNHPLTPFPEYISQGSSVDRSLTGSSADTVLRTSSTIPGGEGQKHQLPVEDSARIPARGTDRRHLVLLLREEDGDAPGRFPRFQRRPTSMSPSMHALVLGLECAVLLVVGSALLWVTVSKKRTSDQHFWTWYVLKTPRPLQLPSLTANSFSFLFLQALDVW